MKWRVKLQVVERRDGRSMYIIYLPRGAVEELGWVKGERLSIEPIIIGTNTETRSEWIGLVVMNPRDCYKVFPENYCREKLES